MQGKLGRRVVVFGRTIVVVWLLSAAAWLQKQDSRDLRDDVHDLKLIAEVEVIEPATELQRLPGPAFKNALRWIGRNRPEEDGARVEVRTRFVDWLHDRGIDPMQMGQFSGKMSAPTDGAIPFRFVSVHDLPQPTQVDPGDARRWLSQPEEDDEPTAGFPTSDRGSRKFIVTVAHLLEELKRLTADRQIACAVDVDTQVLASTYFSNPQPQFGPWDLGPPGDSSNDSPPRVETAGPVTPPDSPPFPPEPPGSPVYGGPAPGIPGIPGEHEILGSPGPPRTADARPDSFGPVVGERRERRVRGDSDETLMFQSASLSGDQIDVRYEWWSPHSNMVQQMDQDAFMDRGRSALIPVETTVIAGPSLLELTDPDRSANESLLKLGTDPERVAYLRRAYGHMPLKDATNLASDGLTQAYRSLTLFGFRFSTRRFPLAVLVCLAAALWQTLAALVALRRQEVGILADIIDDATIEVLVSNRLARFVLWIILPLTALWTSLPLVPLADSEFQTLLIGAAVLAVMGVGCVGTAERSMVRSSVDDPRFSGGAGTPTPALAPHFAGGAAPQERRPPERRPPGVSRD